MRFYVKRRRQPPAVIIVALIDVLIVLLIFLMVTTTFTRLPAVRLTLPESTTAKKSGPSESPPLIVTIDAQGNVFLGADSRPVTLPQLKAELVAAVARNPEVTLALRADTAAQWGPILKVLDVVNQTNIKHKVVPAFVKEAGKP
jgi:biopolymer transport protein ExbD